MEHKYKEVLAVQAKERVSRAQAKVIFDKRNPTFRTMNYAAMAKANTQSDKEDGPQRSGSKANQRNDKETQEQVVPKANFVEVVCVNPDSGDTYT